MARGKSRSHSAPYDRHRDHAHEDAHVRAEAKVQEWAEADTRDKQVVFVVMHFQSTRVTAEQLDQFRQLLLPLFLRTSMSADSVKRILSFLLSYLARPLRLSLPLRPRELFDPRAVNHFVVTHDITYSERTLSRISSAVRHLAHAAGVPGWAKTTRFKKPPRGEPHTDSEAARQYVTARGLPEPARTNALALLDLTYGAGARANQVRHTFGRDVTPTVEGAVIHFVGANSRLPSVDRPVTGDTADRLLQRAQSVGPDHRLVCPTRNGEAPWEDLVTELFQADPSLGRFRIQRAADNWFIRGLESTDVMAFVESWQMSPGSTALTDLARHATRPGLDEQIHILARNRPVPGSEGTP